MCTCIDVPLCGQTSALNNTRAVRETVVEVIMSVPEITAYDAKKESGKAYNTC